MRRSGLVESEKIGCSIEAMSSFGSASRMSQTKKSPAMPIKRQASLRGLLTDPYRPDRVTPHPCPIRLPQPLSVLPRNFVVSVTFASVEELDRGVERKPQQIGGSESQLRGDGVVRSWERNRTA
jgi:hypothetical protein